jgi:hypothetical protein
MNSKIYIILKGSDYSIVRMHKTILLLLLIFLIIISQIPSSNSIIDVTPVSCPSTLSNGERGDINYLIQNIGSKIFKINTINIAVDRGIKSNKSLTSFIPTENITYPVMLSPNSELTIKGEFLSKESGIHYIEVELNYPFNDTKKSTIEYYGLCRVDVQGLQPSDSSNLIQGNINSLIAAVGAIVGGIIGSFFTYRYLKQIEIEKANIEKRKEEKSNNSIKEMVRSELKSYKEFMDKVECNSKKIQENKGFSDVKDTNLMYVPNFPFHDYNSEYKSLPREYTKLSVEKKSNVFVGESLINIEQAYYLFNNFKFIDYHGSVGGRPQVIAGHFLKTDLCAITSSITTALKSLTGSDA